MEYLLHTSKDTKSLFLVFGNENFKASSICGNTATGDATYIWVSYVDWDKYLEINIGIPSPFSYYDSELL